MRTRPKTIEKSRKTATLKNGHEKSVVDPITAIGSRLRPKKPKTNGMPRPTARRRLTTNNRATGQNRPSWQVFTGKASGTGTFSREPRWATAPQDDAPLSNSNSPGK